MAIAPRAVTINRKADPRAACDEKKYEPCRTSPYQVQHIGHAMARARWRVDPTCLSILHTLKPFNAMCLRRIACAIAVDRWWRRGADPVLLRRAGSPGQSGSSCIRKCHDERLIFLSFFGLRSRVGGFVPPLLTRSQRPRLALPGRSAVALSIGLGLDQQGEKFDLGDDLGTGRRRDPDGHAHRDAALTISAPFRAVDHQRPEFLRTETWLTETAAWSNGGPRSKVRADNVRSDRPACPLYLQ
jgi:hypothetical protein